MSSSYPPPPGGPYQPPQGGPYQPPQGGPYQPPQGGPYQPQGGPYQQQPGGMYPPQGGAPIPPKKGVSPIVWILGGLAVVVMVVGIMIVAGGIFLVQKAKRAGFDSALMQKNPALATARIVTALNPELEVLSADDSSGIIRVKNKADGKVYILNFEDAKKGKIVMHEEGKEGVTIQASGDGKEEGKVTFKGPDGTVEMGSSANVKLPSWIPSYPGATMNGTFTSSDSKQAAAMVSFKTNDSPEKVAEFYKEAFKNNGLTLNANFTGSSGNDSGIMISATDADQKRTVTVTAGKSDEGCAGAITYSDKK